MLEGSQIIENIKLRCTPSLTQQSAFPKDFSQGRPFLNDPLTAIVVFSFTVSEETPEEGYNYIWDDLVMVVHRKTLLDLVLLHASLDRQDSAPPLVGWESWGPEVTCWFHVIESAEHFKIYSCGQRCVQHLRADGYDTDEEFEAPRSITIFDFNPWNVRYARAHKERILAARCCLDGFEINVVGEDIPLWDPNAKEEEGKCSSIVKPKKDVSMSQVIFELSTGAHGRLPYVRYTTTNWPYYHPLFIDEKRLIGILASSSFHFHGLRRN